jgi:hypothetical protein
MRNNLGEDKGEADGNSKAPAQLKSKVALMAAVLKGKPGCWYGSFVSSLPSESGHFHHLCLSLTRNGWQEFVHGDDRHGTCCVVATLSFSRHEERNNN